jgi:D-beta-D-heptose 7-phosphate kinase / D-beta-D-heptose 1-phosphate adenosyltransferase
MTVEPLDSDLLYELEQLTLTPQLPRTLALVSPEILVVGDSGLRDLTGLRGAASIAADLAGLGARVELLSICGDDAPGALLRQRLAGRDVDTSGLVVESDRPTGGSPAIGRSIRRSTTRAMTSGLVDRARHADCVLVADRGLGVVNGQMRQVVKALRAELPPLIVEAIDVRPWAPTRPDLVAWTAPAVGMLLGSSPSIDDDQRAARVRAELARHSGADTHLLMLDDGGTLLMEHQRQYRTWAAPPGRGTTEASIDSIIATVAIGMVAELPLVTSAELAQIAGDATAVRPGEPGCTTAALAARLAGCRSAVLPAPELEHRVWDHRLAGRRVMMTSGTFDLLHANDIDWLNQIRRRGDVLIVAVYSDAAARRVGRRRPLHPAADRAATVAALSGVDHVTITEDESPVELFDAVSPHVYLPPKYFEEGRKP